MSAPIASLAAFVGNATREYRHGAEVTASRAGGVDVVEVFAMPHKDDAEGHVTVDMGFVVVGFTEVAAGEAEFVELLRAALGGRGEFCDISAQDFLGGPSYITAGAWLGSQDLALRLYALLQHYGLASVVLPRSLGITGDDERQMMGGGFVIFSPTVKLRDALTQAATR